MQLAIPRSPNVAITLRRDEHPGFDIRLPNTGRQFRNDEAQPMGRGVSDRVALLKARLGGARRLHFSESHDTGKLTYAARRTGQRSSSEQVEQWFAGRKGTRETVAAEAEIERDSE